MKTIVLAGGGTGGHIYPALALLDELPKYFDRIFFVGGDGMEKTIVPQYGIKFFATANAKFSRRHLVSNLKIPFALSRAIKEARELLVELKPDVVFAKGGYASLPAAFAARSLGIPVVNHESDFTMGLANRLIAEFAAKVLTAFPETKGGECVGNPVRSEIFVAKNASHAVYGLNPSKKTVLFFGGSLGASFINQLVYDNLDALTAQYNILHICGKNGDTSKKAHNYWQGEYSDDMGSLYALADLVVSRGGANALAEIAALAKPALIIPLPKGTSRGDQIDNAKSYQKRGIVEVLTQESCTYQALDEGLRALANMPKRSAEGVLANKKIVEAILAVIKN